MRPLSIFCISAALLLAGCTTAPIQPMAVPGLEKSSTVVIEDLRPPTETQKEIFSLLITSEAYGIYRVMEAATNPTAVRLLAHRAFETFPELANSPKIKVHHFVTYANLQSQLRKGALGGAIGGALGGVLASQSAPVPGEVYTIMIDSAAFEQTASKEHQRAFFTKLENPTKAGVNVIYIETEILGRRIATRSLVPPLKNKPNATLAEIIDISIANHLAFYKKDATAQK